MEVQIAESLPQEIRDALRGTPVADRKVDLLALARMEDVELRRQVVEALAEGGASTVAAALKQLDADPSGEPEGEGETSAQPEPVYDKLGHLITDPGIAAAFTLINARTREALRHLRAAQRIWGHFHEEQVAAERYNIFASNRRGDYHTLREIFERQLPFLIHQLKYDSPYTLCPYCGGAPWTNDQSKQCEACGGVGWGGRYILRNAPPEYVAALDAKGIYGVNPSDPEDEEGDAGTAVAPPQLSPIEVTPYGGT